MKTRPIYKSENIDCNNCNMKINDLCDYYVATCKEAIVMCKEDDYYHYERK